MTPRQQTPATSSAPTTEALTAAQRISDAHPTTASKGLRLLAAEGEIAALRDALAAKASALDALVAVCEEVAACSSLDDGYHKNAAARFYAALTAAKAAQVSK